jgi:hypothetical protein
LAAYTLILGRDAAFPLGDVGGKSMRERHAAAGGRGLGKETMAMTGKNRIMIYGPKDDGTYVSEFRTAEGCLESLRAQRKDSDSEKG